MKSVPSQRNDETRLDSKAQNLNRSSEEIIRDLIDRAGGPSVAGASFYRKNDDARTNAKSAPYALRAWCWQVLARANENQPKSHYARGTVTMDFLKTVAKLSRFENGPRRVEELLASLGVSLVIV